MGCTNDSRKNNPKLLRKHPSMMHRGKVVDFFFIKRRPREVVERWLKSIRRVDFTPTENSVICSRHFIDSKPTSANPVPSLFAYNDYGMRGAKPRQRTAARVETETRSGDELHHEATLLKEPSSFFHVPAFITEVVVSTTPQRRKPTMTSSKCIMDHLLDCYCYFYGLN